MWETQVGSLGWENSPGEENDNPLQYSRLGNPTDRGSWQDEVHGISKSWTQLQLCVSLNILWHCLFGIGIKTDLFQSCDHCWVFQICWHTECSTLTASSFRVWNMSTRIPSPPLTLFIVMLPKAHLTSYSRMSDSRWVITPSWFIWVVKIFFVQFFCVFLLPLLDIFCFC